MELSTTVAALSATKSAIELISKLSDIRGSRSEIPRELLGMALLEAEFNLALLGSVKFSGTSSTDPGYIEFAARLRHEAITAMLLSWEEVEEPPKGSRLPSVFRGEKSWKMLASDLEPSGETILSVARYIVVKAPAFAALAEIPEEVRKRTYGHLRLKRLLAANRLLRDGLRSKDALAALRPIERFWESD